MDILSYPAPFNEPILGAKIVNGIQEVTWIERFFTNGEFIIKGPVANGLKEALPIGGLVSHTNSISMMITETHEINTYKDKPDEIVITGRSFDTVLERRVVGANRRTQTPANYGYLMGNAFTPTLQANYLCYYHVSDSLESGTGLDQMSYVYDALPYLSFLPNSRPDWVKNPSNETRSIKMGSLYTRVREILSSDGAGIYVYRPGLTTTNARITIYFSYGSDRRNTVTFTHDNGDFESAQYLWSDKNRKTVAIVTGRWLGVRVTKPGYSSMNDGGYYRRRMLHVDASDLDSGEPALPTGETATAIREAMSVRGLEVLSEKKDVELVSVEISPNRSKYGYRNHYLLGDLVSVHGLYNTKATMRVSEHVEIQDENGERRYPTLEAYEPNEVPV